MLLLSLSSGCVISRVCMWAFSFLRVYTLCLCPPSGVRVSCLCCCVWLYFFFPLLMCLFMVFPTPQTGTLVNNSTYYSLMLQTAAQHLQWCVFCSSISYTSISKKCVLCMYRTVQRFELSVNSYIMVHF